MAELPQGTVTLVFTDIEGSTRLLASLGSRYEAVLADHRKLLRDAFSSHSGIEVDTQGDALFYAFARAQDAVRGAVEAQQILASHDFGEGVELRVRMGIHTGEPSLSDEGYVGSDVHLGARISAVAWGGQVVVSSATAALVGGDANEVSLRSLGQHALKDIDDRVELHQVVVPGLREDFPALRSMSAHPTNLPARLAPLIGREDDIAGLVELLSSEDVSVVTLVGPGGTGKTRLALAVGAELLSFFSDGVFFVDLSALSDASLVVPAIAQALSLREAAGRSLTETLGVYLSSKEMVLILDNFEQVMDAAGEVSALVETSSSLKIVVTSREALRIEGEREFPLHPLALSSSDSEVEEILASPAVELFVTRAQAVRPGLAVSGEDARHVASICRRLDGLPLAIELAAARVKVLSPGALSSRLETSLGALGSGRRDASDRQRTLSGAIAWSYDLLDEDEQRLFARLGVFAGGWSLEAAEQVCDSGDLAADVLDGIASLVDKNLVRVVEGDEARFSMLETVRDFALEVLEGSWEAEKIRRRHAVHFRALAEEADPHLVGADQKLWLDRLERERANLRAALDWSLRGGAAEAALPISVSLWRFWRVRGPTAEWRKWLSASLAISTTASSLRARALRALSIVCELSGDYEAAQAAAAEAVALYKEQGDSQGMAQSLEVLAGLAQESGELDRALALYHRVRHMYEDLADEFGAAVATGSLANLAILQQRYSEALSLAEEAKEWYEEHGDTEGVIHALLTTGFADLGRGLPSEGAAAFQSALAVSKNLTHMEGVAVSLEGLAAVAVELKMFVEAAILLGKATLLRDEGGLFRQLLEDRFYQKTLASLRRHPDCDRLDDMLRQGARIDERTLDELIQRITSIDTASGT